MGDTVVPGGARALQEADTKWQLMTAWLTPVPGVVGPGVQRRSPGAQTLAGYWAWPGQLQVGDTQSFVLKNGRALSS